MFVMTLLDSSREVRSSSLNVIPARRKHAHHPRSGIHPVDPRHFFSCGIPCGEKSDGVTVSTNEMSACQGSAAAAQLRTRAGPIFAIGL